jgi:hypothetical protein
MGNKIFATDLDGCLLDSGTGFAEMYSEILGKKIFPADLYCWDMAWALGITKETVDEMWRRVWDEKPFKPYPEAEAFLANLKHYLGYEVAVITSRPTLAAKKAALRDIQALSIDNLIIMDSALCPKSHYVNRLGPEYYLEDNIKFAVDVYANANCKDVFLFHRPWNAGCKDIVGYRRIYSYADVLSHLS